MNQKILLFILFNTLCLNLLHAQSYTTIPDSYFEQALIDQGIDSGTIDGRVLTSAISGIKDLYVISKDISSLTGIQDFVALTSLNCAYNKLATIDLSKNTALKSLDCSSNQLTTLSIVNNTGLNTLVCASNQLASLNVAVNTALTTLNCSNNKLTNLNVSSNILLEQLTCTSNQLTSINITANDSLVSLDCSSNQLTNLNLTNNTVLSSLFCASNQIEVLATATNESLTMIDCSNNQIKNMDVSSNTYLTYLTCSSNQLSTIDLAQNDSMVFLNISNNQLSALDISNNDSLLNLICASNQLTSIDLSINTAIESIDLSHNLLSDLDLGTNTALKSVDCSNNLLSTLNIKNGNNGIIEKLDATHNPYLRCVQVDNVAAANSKTGWKKDSTATYKLVCGLYTYVPDANFEAALAVYDDIPNDKYIPTTNIENLTTLNVTNRNIADLTGIEDFTNLETLRCDTNQLVNLDMTHQTNLVTLNCSSNNLVDLNLKNAANAVLLSVDARNNPALTCIQVDSVAAADAQVNWLKDATASYNLDCNASKTYVPDDRFEAALIMLGYDKGSLDDYVVTDSINTIHKLDISNQNILDLTGIADFVALDTLDCSENNLISIELSTLVKLKSLDCRGNFLTNLDVTADTLLTNLIGGDNKLSSLDVSQNSDLKQLICNGNNLKSIDLTTNIHLQELNFNTNYVSTIDIDTNTHIQKLFCANNKLSSLNLTNNILLNELDCASNNLSQLNLQSNPDLIRLDCSGNGISSLDLSKDTLLVSINCNSNLISALDVSKNQLVRTLYCESNKLTSINLASNDSIRELSAANNKLTLMSIDSLRFLNKLNVADNQITALDFSKNDSLQILLCSNNKLQAVNTGSNLLLETIKCANNQLNTLDIGNNASLIELDCSKNNLDTIDLSSALSLIELVVDNNKLTALDISGNAQLQRISCSSNLLESLDFADNEKLNALTCSFNQLTSLNGKNGRNGILTSFNSINNPNLQCIEIDDTANIGSSWMKDATASYSENCRYVETYIPDDNFEAALSVIVGEPSNNHDNYISTASIQGIATLNISNKNISDLTGLEDFTALTSLNCSGNQLDSLDLSTIDSLTNLNCANNLIDTLVLSNNSLLTDLDVSSNLLSEIDVTDLDFLTSLVCNNNSIISLDLRSNTNLTSVNCASNQLITLYANNGNNTDLTTFNATNNSGLLCVQVDDSDMANSGAGVYANWQFDSAVTFGNNCHYFETYIPDDAFEQALIDLGYDYPNTVILDDYIPTKKISPITYLTLTDKAISDLTGIEALASLVTFNCSNNKIASIDLSSNLALVTLNCANNVLANINISHNASLNKLDITNNLLTSLDINSNMGLERLLCASNQLTNLNILSNTALTEVNCSSNKLITVDANNGNNAILQYFDLRNNPKLNCILVDDILASAGYSGWYKDVHSAYKLVCEDDDNDGVADTDDLCPDTPYGDLVDVFGCTIFMLPANNFTVLTKSETCRGGNNGIVNISANEIYNYTATLNGTIDTIVFKFTTNADIRNLKADSYSLCITIDEIPNYLQCYEVFISQPDDLNVEPMIDETGKSVTLKMSGGTNYTIDFNGHKFSTTETEVTMNLEKGKNTVQITTDAACQGKYTNSFYLSDGPAVYPNPFKDYFDIYSGDNKSNTLDVKLFSYSGQVVFSNSFAGNNGAVQIVTSGFKPGVYYLWMKSETKVSTIKIVKE